MEIYFLLAGQALCLFSLWSLARRDLVRLTQPAVRVDAVVTGYRSRWEDGRHNYAPVYRFTSADGEREVVEMLYRAAQSPPVGTVVALRHPVGRPDLARVPRPLLWLLVYGLLVGLDAMLLAKMMGWLQG